MLVKIEDGVWVSATDVVALTECRSKTGCEVILSTGLSVQVEADIDAVGRAINNAIEGKEGWE
jgi:hypothetical protein